MSCPSQLGNNIRSSLFVNCIRPSICCMNGILSWIHIWDGVLFDSLHHDMKWAMARPGYGQGKGHSDAPAQDISTICLQNTCCTSPAEGVTLTSHIFGAKISPVGRSRTYCLSVEVRKQIRRKQRPATGQQPGRKLSGCVSQHCLDATSISSDALYCNYTMEGKIPPCSSGNAFNTPHLALNLQKVGLPLRDTDHRATSPEPALELCCQTEWQLQVTTQYPCRGQWVGGRGKGGGRKRRNCSGER